MDAAARIERLFRKVRAIRSSSTPLLHEPLDSSDVIRVRIKDGINVPRGPNHPMADQRYAADQDVTNPGLVQVSQDAAEAGHRLAAARSIARADRAIPSASSSSGSRVASRISR